jgi:hypothetical protein
MNVVQSLAADVWGGQLLLGTPPIFKTVTRYAAGATITVYET